MSNYWQEKGKENAVSFLLASGFLTLCASAFGYMLSKSGIGLYGNANFFLFNFYVPPNYACFGFSLLNCFKLLTPLMFVVYLSSMYTLSYLAYKLGLEAKNDKVRDEIKLVSKHTHDTLTYLSIVFGGLVLVGIIGIKLYGSGYIN